VTSYQGDPLSRFDLYFRDNTTTGTVAGSGFANKFDPLGYYLYGYAPYNPNQSLTAYYNDSDGVFKSRLSTATPPGPFTGTADATRLRNATRQAAPVGGSPIYYPGMGASTWRVSSDSVDGTYFNSAPGGNTVDPANASNIYYNGYFLFAPINTTEPGSYVFGEF
jgi:hypothetical protein